METEANEEAIGNWLKRAKVDLHYLSVHLEKHGSRALNAKLEGRADEAKYEESIVEMYHRRIKELRWVIQDEEANLPKHAKQLR
jgi:hypothetical protein